MALGDCVVKLIRHDDLSQYFRDNPAKVMSMLGSLSEKLSTAYRMFGYACQTFEEFVETARSGKPVSEGLKAKALRRSGRTGLSEADSFSRIGSVDVLLSECGFPCLGREPVVCRVCIDGTGKTGENS